MKVEANNKAAFSSTSTFHPLTASLLAAALSALILFSCKPSRHATAIPPERFNADSLLTEVAKSSRQFNWFAAKARVNYEDKSISKSFNTAIRMRKDSIIWISVTTIMGVEAARLLIHDDSVHFIDRMNKKYESKPLSFLEQYIPFPFEIGLIQKILVGDAMPVASDKIHIKKEKEGCVLFSENNHYRHTIKLKSDNLTISTEHLVDRQNDRSVSLIFDDYHNDDRGLFSYRRTISFSGDEKISLTLKFSKIKWDEPQTFPFHAGEKYD
ncbi:MAG TPA: DUF4292 domain-containing protein [Chitinophagales bacterium]|nr:DUF4292 domain-containing protein [Chitinophagales bacterium]